MGALEPPPPIVVEQLNASQWHVVFPDGRHASGVTNWVDATAYALLCGTCDGQPVESVDLNWTRLLLSRANRIHAGGRA